MAKLPPVLLLLEVAVIVVAHWTTMTGIPYFQQGGAAAFGDIVFAAVETRAYTFDTTTGIWTTVSSRPITSFGAAVGALSGQRAIVAGKIPPVATVHMFALQTGAWTVKANLPVSVGYCAAGCDGQHFWVAAGGLPTAVHSDLQEYDSDADVWTSKAALPIAAGYISGSYCDGTFIVTKDAVIHVYTVAHDAWTTGMSLPSHRGGLIGGVVSLAGFGFVVGGNAFSGNVDKLEKYDIGNDLWVSLDPIPTPGSFALAAVTSSGLLVAIGNFPSGTYVHGFTTGLVSPASLVGDPVVTTFSGREWHLDLWPGSFSLLTTPTVMVSAVVEELLTLPPDENTVMTAVAIAGQVAGSVVMVHCSADPTLVCSATAKDVSPFALTNGGSKFSVKLPEFIIDVVLNAVAFVPNNVTLLTSYLDVHVHPRMALPPSTAGLLCIDDKLNLIDYEIPSGCLLETEVGLTAPATENVFSLALKDACW